MTACVNRQKSVQNMPMHNKNEFKVIGNVFKTCMCTIRTRSSQLKCIQNMHMHNKNKLMSFELCSRNAYSQYEQALVIWNVFKTCFLHDKSKLKIKNVAIEFDKFQIWHFRFHCLLGDAAPWSKTLSKASSFSLLSYEWPALAVCATKVTTSVLRQWIWCETIPSHVLKELVSSMVLLV